MSALVLSCDDIITLLISPVGVLTSSPGANVMNPMIGMISNMFQINDALPIQTATAVSIFFGGGEPGSGWLSEDRCNAP